MGQQSKNTYIHVKLRFRHWLFKDMKFPQTKYFLVGKRRERLKTILSAVCNYSRREAINWLKELKQYRNNLNIIRKAPRSVWPEKYLPFTDHTHCQVHTQHAHTNTRAVMWSEVAEPDRKRRWIPTILNEQAGLKCGLPFLNSHHTMYNV